MTSPRATHARVVVVVVVVVGTVALAACLPPSQECRDYVACQHAFDASVDTTAFEEGGSCWTTPQNAAACTAECEQALEALQAVPDPPSECR